MNAAAANIEIDFVDSNKSLEFFGQGSGLQDEVFAHIDRFRSGIRVRRKVTLRTVARVEFLNFTQHGRPDEGATQPSRLHLHGFCGSGDDVGMDEGQLTALLRLLPTPAAVTIARSIDGFVPFRCVELLEAAVLRALRAAFANSTASATPGASSRTLTLSSRAPVALAIDYLPGCASSASLRALRRS